METEQSGTYQYGIRQMDHNNILAVLDNLELVHDCHIGIHPCGAVHVVAWVEVQCGTRSGKV